MHKRFFVLLFVIFLVSVSCRSESILPTQTAVSIAPTAVLPIATSIPLTQEQEIANLVAFTRLYGVVRYFHPSDQVAAINDWDGVVINGIEAVRDARTPEALAEQLNNFFAPLAPTVLVTVGEVGEGETAVFQPDTLDNHSLTMWEHYGVEADNTYELYTSERIFTSAATPAEQFHDPRQPYVQPLGNDLYAYVPLSLFVTTNKTLPIAPTDFGMPHSQESNSQTSYLASAIMFWAVTQHFYPYFDAVDTDWSASLDETMQRMLDGESEQEWETALRLLVADLNDGHSRFEVKTPLYTPYVSLDWIEEQVVVVEAVGQAGTQLQPGDVVLAIDGEDAVDRLEAQMRLISGATPQRKRFAALLYLLSGGEATQVTVTVEHADGTQEDVQLERNMLAYSFVPDNRPENFSELAPDVYYINLTNSDQQLLSQLTALENVQGLIFDLRGYPTVDADFMRTIITDTIATAQFLIPQTSTPNQEDVTFDKGGWSLGPYGSVPISRNVVFLTDGSAISYSETLLAMVKHHQVGEIVGEATAGTNGNVNTIILPTGHTVRWTGMKVINQDGSQHHGIGVTPTVPVLQTLADLRNGVDTQLQAALELIEANGE